MAMNTTPQTPPPVMSLAYISPADSVMNSFSDSQPKQSDAAPSRPQQLGPTSPPLTESAFSSPTYSENSSRPDESASNEISRDPLLYPTTSTRRSSVLSPLFPQTSPPPPGAPQQQLPGIAALGLPTGRQTPLPWRTLPRPEEASRRHSTPSASTASPTLQGSFSPHKDYRASQTPTEPTRTAPTPTPAQPTEPVVEHPHVSTVFERYTANPVRYRSQVADDNSLLLLARAAARQRERDAQEAREAQAAAQEAPRRERAIAPRPHTTSTPRDATPRTKRGKRTAKEAFTESGERAVKKRAPPQQKDKPQHWKELEGVYCPPLKTLNRKNATMRPTFPAGTKPPTPLDLSNDPDRQYLHELEVQCASLLRLSCNDYLINKLSIMKEKKKHVKVNKPFLKTHAQQASCIDVNKASRLWEVFDKAGWFDASYFDGSRTHKFDSAEVEAAAALSV